jgi:hypothetical protein
MKETITNTQNVDGVNIEMELRERRWGMYWIHLAQDKDQWRVPVNMATYLRVP